MATVPGQCFTASRDNLHDALIWYVCLCIFAGEPCPVRWWPIHLHHILAAALSRPTVRKPKFWLVSGNIRVWGRLPLLLLPYDKGWDSVTRDGVCLPSPCHSEEVATQPKQRVRRGGFPSQNCCLVRQRIENMGGKEREGVFPSHI